MRYDEEKGNGEKDVKKRSIGWVIVPAAALILSSLVFGRKKPKLISSIRVMDKAYLTVLADERESQDAEKLKETILKMCREDSFEDMKLHTEDRPLPESLHISVYLSEKDLKEGNIFLTIRSEAEKSPPM